MQPVRESREPVERAKTIAAGDSLSRHEVLALTGLLDRLARSFDRLEGAADGAANENLHAALADAAKMQGLCAEPEAQQHPKFSVNIGIPTRDQYS